MAHARPGSFEDAFFFSVQTMGTIGYGAMYPESPIANAIMVGETFVSLTLTALMTGLIFAKFSRPTARVVFSREATIGPMNGIPHPDVPDRQRARGPHRRCAHSASCSLARKRSSRAAPSIG